MRENAIIEFLSNNGPSTPAQLAKYLNINQIFASAMLGETVSNNKEKIRISNLKIGGGSPLYYIREHEDRLQNFSQNLNAKDRQAYELLKTKKILRDREQSALVRVSLRQIQDFAVQLNITRAGNTEIFWKWHMLTDKEAESEIRKILGIHHEEKTVKEENKEKKETGQETSPEKTGKYKDLSMPKTDIKEINQKQESNMQNGQEMIKEMPNIVIRKENQMKIGEKEQSQDRLQMQGSQGDLNAEFSIKYPKGFGKRVIDFIEQKGIKIKNYEQIKKNKEFTMILSVPSSVGSSRFYCKALDKKKISEGELALAIVEAQERKLAGLFMTTGELAKKTEAKMETIFKEINLIYI
jgi:hypothetical protein